jgi:hypothetical protein
MLAKRPLSAIEVQVIATRRDRHPALEPTLSLQDSELTVDVVSLAWGVHELLRRLFEDEEQSSQADETARELFGS